MNRNWRVTMTAWMAGWLGMLRTGSAMAEEWKFEDAKDGAAPKRIAFLLATP